MVFSTRLSLAALGAAALVSAQTPPDANPSTDVALGLTFGTTDITPNGLLIPQTTADAGAPTVYSNTSYPGTYTFALVDLLIPFSVVAADDFATLVPGLGCNRTTRLHWWMDEVTQGSDGVFTGNSTLADFEGPQPPAGDIPHDYVLMLFNRPASFTPMADSEAFYDASTYNGDDRMNFSVPALAAQVGNPIAARYIRVEATGNVVNTTNTYTGVCPTATLNGNSTALSNSTSTSNSTTSSYGSTTSSTSSSSGSTTSNTTTSSSPIASAYTGAAGQLTLSVSGLALAALTALFLI